MEELTKMHVDWKKTTVVVALVMLTALTVGGLTWYTADNGFQNELESYKNEISTLQTEVAQLKAENIQTDDRLTDTGEALGNEDAFNFNLTLPAGWSKTIEDKENLGLVKLNGAFTINIVVNSEGTDAGMASIQKKYTATVNDKNVSLFGPKTETMSDLTESSYSITTSSFSYNGNEYYAYSYLGSQADQDKYLTTFKQILESLTFG